MKTQGLAAASRQKGKDIAAGQRIPNDLFLEGTKGDKAEVLLQQRQQGRGISLHTGIGQLEGHSEPRWNSGRGLVDGEPIVADASDDLSELFAIGRLDDVAIDAELVTFDEFDGEFGGGEDNDGNAFGEFVGL